jgi:hypothetical protein
VKGVIMEFLEIINKQFESIYDDSEMQIVNITSDDIAKVIEFSNMELPDMLLDILKKGISYGIETIERNKVIQFLNVYDILDDDIYYPHFIKQIKKGIIFGNDLGDGLYFYGEGKDGIGIYVVGGTVGDYYNNAIKLAVTFEDFFIKGIGIDVLVKGF